jgi:sorbitol-6-phosphate 2-dehydrogenase
MSIQKILEGKTVVITGAAQGLGQALAIRASNEGANVVIGDMNIEGANDTAKQCENALALKLDVTKYDECEALMKAAKDRYSKIDIVISNAAIIISGAIDELDADKWKLVVDVNLCGFYNTAKAAAPYLKQNDNGVIIQINSKSGKKGSYKNSAYAASKFGGIGLVQSLALELAEDNIRVNAICPGNLLNSPLWTKSLFKQYAKNQGVSEEKIRAKYINQVPLKRSCEYEDVENALVFLVSDEASYMTGQAINVTGGQQMT